MKLSIKGKKKTKKPIISQRNILITIVILTVVVLLGYLQQSAPEETEITEPPVVEGKEEQTCTTMWLCQDENTKSYRKSDCTFEQITDCPAGCENAECKEITGTPVVEVKKPETETKEEPQTGECTIGFKCMDENRVGYQLSNCVFNQVVQCDYGCKNGECIKDAPPEAEIEETFKLTQGKLTLNKTGWRFSDFDKDELFYEEINSYDFKLKLYSSASGYNYFRVESSGDKIWIIDKEATEATRKDCMENKLDANAYGNLRTAQTVCIGTKEKDIALVGATWEGSPKEDTELTWKYYT
jgi:hypothetical protein